MAVLFEITPEEQEWINNRPDCVRKMIDRCPPNRLYRLKTTDQRVTLYAYHENDTVTVDILGKFNLIDFERRVFGISLDDLEECDLPDPSEPLGVICQTKEEVQARIEQLREELGLCNDPECACSVPKSQIH